MEVLLTKFSFALESTKQLAKIRYKNQKECKGIYNNAANKVNCH